MSLFQGLLSFRVFMSSSFAQRLATQRCEGTNDPRSRKVQDIQRQDHRGEAGNGRWLVAPRDQKHQPPHTHGHDLHDRWES